MTLIFSSSQATKIWLKACVEHTMHHVLQLERILWNSSSKEKDGHLVYKFIGPNPFLCFGAMGGLDLSDQSGMILFF